MTRQTPNPRNGFERVPQELKERSNWLMWDNSKDAPRRPHWAGDFGISWNDPDVWRSFEKAKIGAELRDSWGIGYVMGLDNPDVEGGYACLDIDGGLREPYEEKPKEWVPSIEDFLATGAYVEFSPSGEGLHIPVSGRDAPRWWKDSHFTVEGHEGVDYLTNRFVTVTGNPIRPAGPQVTTADPEPFLSAAYETLNDDQPTITESTTERSPWKRSDIQTALSFLDPDMPYPEWRDVAFAVHDYDAEYTGKELFENWSRRGEKWDRQSEALIDNIWSNSDPGGGVTLGTLIYMAQKAGWNP